jgi:hypothetical protein
MAWLLQKPLSNSSLETDGASPIRALKVVVASAAHKSAPLLLADPYALAGRASALRFCRPSASYNYSISENIYALACPQSKKNSAPRTSRAFGFRRRFSIRLADAPREGHGMYRGLTAPGPLDIVVADQSCMRTRLE